jgi:hypothetical protein
MIYDRSTNSQQQPDLVQLPKKATEPTKILTEEIIYLLEERLMVDINRHKTGEIVVRKEIETQLLHVEVPVRREKLIVEQVSPEYKLLAQIDLGQDYATDGTPAFAIHDPAISVSHQPQLPSDRSTNGVADRDRLISSEVKSPQAAIDLLTEFARMAGDDFETIRIEIALKDRRNRDTYQRLFAGDRAGEIR